MSSLIFGIITVALSHIICKTIHYHKESVTEDSRDAFWRATWDDYDGTEI